MFLITEGFKSGSTINKQLLSPLTLADSVTGVTLSEFTLSEFTLVIDPS